jgi:hypothetical protein
MKKLPIGLQNLRKMRTEGYAYVDKTPFVAQLAEQGFPGFRCAPSGLQENRDRQKRFTPQAGGEHW